MTEKILDSVIQHLLLLPVDEPVQKLSIAVEDESDVRHEHAQIRDCRPFVGVECLEVLPQFAVVARRVQSLLDLRQHLLLLLGERVESVLQAMDRGCLETAEHRHGGVQVVEGVQTGQQRDHFGQRLCSLFQALLPHDGRRHPARQTANRRERAEEKKTRHQTC